LGFSGEKSLRGVAHTFDQLILVVMYDYALVERSFQLKRLGLTDQAIAAHLEISVRTVRHWRYGTRQRIPPDQRRYGNKESRHPPCARCTGPDVPGAAYAYLLGLYLGDGLIVDKKSQHTLAISFSTCWPGLMDACEAAMRAVMPHNKVWRRARPGVHDVLSSSVHWTCLFPQHGPGRKHERSIILEPWQQEIVDEYPEDFVRGLIHSDGCRVYNVATRTRGDRTTRYYYARYHFSNKSVHIRQLFTDTLDKLGIEWRYNNPNKNISIARRESVKRLDSFVGATDPPQATGAPSRRSAPHGGRGWGADCSPFHGPPGYGRTRHRAAAVPPTGACPREPTAADRRAQRSATATDPSPETTKAGEASGPHPPSVAAADGYSGAPAVRLIRLPHVPRLHLLTALLPYCASALR
jgi:hypothetical protein